MNIRTAGWRCWLAAMAVAALAPGALATGDNWLTDFDAAKTKAAQDKKDILVDFSGSDWCGWCIKLDEEVFSKKEFQDAAMKDFVLVVLDFPRKPENKAKIPEEQQKKNQELMQKLGVQGFPTVVLFDSAGEAYARTGYQPGGVEPYLKSLNELKGNKVKRTELKSKLAQPGLSGADKAKVLDELIQASDPELAGDEVRKQMEEIVALDADGKLGFKARYQIKLRVAEADAAMEKRDLEGALKVFQGIIDELKPTGENLQDVYFQMGGAYFYKQDMENVRRCLTEALKAAPESEKSGQIKQMMERFAEKEPAKPADAK